ncbi:MAG: hypothetical protein H0Z38_04920 [Firmicutes bacterium]|nr:hypothetical protein [Bacillota bacterium]
MKKILITSILLVLTFSSAAGAAELADKLAVGFQITPHFSGFSFKYQLDEDQIVQPIFYISAEGINSDNKVLDNTFAVRVLYDMGSNGSYQHYLGWGVGLVTHKNYEDGAVQVDETSYAAQGFVGFEKGSPLATSIELSLGLAEDSSDSGSGSFEAGFGLGLGFHYHF